MAKTKIKTHRGAAKRFNVTKNGKVKNEQGVQKTHFEQKDKLREKDI